MSETITHAHEVGDRVEFQPRLGKPLMVVITHMFEEGFKARHMGNVLRVCVGRHDQVIRILRKRDQVEVEHVTQTVGSGPGFAAWNCECGESGVATGKDEDEAKAGARYQRQQHVNNGKAEQRAAAQDVA